jgi:cbb3-type cytochrome oxidase subunit 3
MSRDKIVSWPTWALFILFPLLAVLAIIFFPITILVVYWSYIRGKRQAIGDSGANPQSESHDQPAEE